MRIIPVTWPECSAVPLEHIPHNLIVREHDHRLTGNVESTHHAILGSQVLVPHNAVTLESGVLGSQVGRAANQWQAWGTRWEVPRLGGGFVQPVQADDEE